MANRPQTLYALEDSPVGLAAWMLDHDARSLSLIARVFDGEAEGLTKDDILDNVDALLVDEDGGVVGSPLLGEQAPVLRAEGCRPAGRGQRLPGRDLRRPAELGGEAYPKLIHYNRLAEGRPLRGLGAAADVLRGGAGGVPVVALISGRTDSEQKEIGCRPALVDLRQIDAGPLSVGYVEVGPADGRAALLLHGWPYDIHSFADVAPLLAARRVPGDRALRPRLRHDTVPVERHDAERRSRRPSQSDVVALMDALGIDRAIVAGFDWGARSANVVAALWPDRCRGRLGERIPHRQPGGGPAAAAARSRTPVVVPVLLRDRTRPRRLRARPARLREADLADWRRRNGTSTMPRSIGVPRRWTTLITWRSRSRTTAGGSVWPRARLGTTTSSGSSRKVPTSRSPRSRSKATRTARRIPSRMPTRSEVHGSYAHRTITGGIGHNLPQEAPEAFAEAVVDVDAF